MKFPNIKKAIVILLSIAFFAGTFIFLRNLDKKADEGSDAIINLSDGWTLELDQNVQENVNVEAVDIKIVNFMETVTITRNLDIADPGFDSPCLNFYSSHALVNVYLDHDLIYSYGQDYFNNQNSVPKKSHYIPLGNDYLGKSLRITFTGGRNDAFSNISGIYLGSRSALLSLYISTIRHMMVVGIFMFTIGLVLIILSPFLFLYHNRDLRIFFSGLISLVLGTYILGYYGIFDMLVDNSLLNTVMEYAALYNVPTAITGYLMSVFTGKVKKAYALMFYLDVFLFLSSLVLHFTHVGRFSQYTLILHIVAFIEFVFTVYILGRTYLGRRKELLSRIHFSDNIFLLGVLSFMLLSLTDIIRHNFFKYGTAVNTPYTELLGFSIGSMIFVSCLLVSYLFYNISSSSMASMQSKIANLAYTDPLTGLSNRARCETMMSYLTQEHSNYTIISLDLNKLKQVNDTYGHREGDRLITGFSTILSDCFWDANLIGRMGGDEFIVILMEDRALQVTKRLHELYALINEWNRKEQLFKYSASYGYAYSYEVPNGSAKEVYMLADSRMYEMKREHQANKEAMENA